MLSNCTSDVHQNLARRLGAADYFTKPYMDKQLLSALQNLLDTGLNASQNTHPVTVRAAGLQ